MEGEWDLVCLLALDNKTRCGKVSRAHKKRSKLCGKWIMTLINQKDLLNAYCGVRM